jgi:hypothetical protein
MGSKNVVRGNKDTAFYEAYGFTRDELEPFLYIKPDNTPRVFDGELFQVKRGDYPAKISLEMSGVPNRVQELYDCNPSIELDGLIIGSFLKLPPSWRRSHEFSPTKRRFDMWMDRVEKTLTEHRMEEK